MLFNFSYLVEGLVAGSARPGYGDGLREELLWLYDEGFRGVVTLTAKGLPNGLLRETSLKGLHLPVRDFSPPTPKQIETGVSFVASMVQQETPVLVHCGSGYGRTGTMLACYLVSTGLNSAEAIRSVREKRPGSIETFEQEEAVHAYASSLGRGV